METFEGIAAILEIDLLVEEIDRKDFLDKNRLAIGGGHWCQFSGDIL